MFTNKSDKNNNQRNIVSIVNSKLQNEEDSIKIGAVSWEESLFLEQKTPAGEFYCPNLKAKDEFCIYNVLANFKSQLAIGNKNLEEARKKNTSLSYEASYDEIEE